MPEPRARKGPRIVHTLNRSVGQGVIHTAVWIIALAVPVFWIIRVAEWVVYPANLDRQAPALQDAEWVNASARSPTAWSPRPDLVPGRLDDRHLVARLGNAPQCRAGA
ncbi:MAG: hypothetical protein R3C45_13260 [Phycisphaerales bacterium]